jgi:hypothetical protein
MHVFMKSHWNSSSEKGSKVVRIIGWTLGGLLLAVIFAFLFGLIVQMLWNWLMPAIFGLGKISYWQAFGIIILAKILFSGISHHRDNGHDYFRRKFHDKERASDINRDLDWVHSEDPKNWKYYRQYWKDEGKEAFEKYVRRIEEEKEEK